MSNKITHIASTKQELRQWINRVGVPAYIPDEQVGKYRALVRQRNCDAGKIKKKEKVAQQRKKMEEKKREDRHKNNMARNKKHL